PPPCCTWGRWATSGRRPPEPSTPPRCSRSSACCPSDSPDRLGTRRLIAAVPCRSHSRRGGVAFMPEPYPDLEPNLHPLPAPLPAPRPGDWLAEHAEPGQTFAEYLDARPVRRSDKLTTIYLCLVGDFSEAQRRILALTHDYLALFFDCPVKVQRQV